MFITFKRIIRAGWQNLFRDGNVSAATIFILVLAILLSSAIFFFRDISQLLISQLREKVDVSVYFKEDASEENIFKIKDELVAVPEVKKITYTSKETARDEFVKRHKDDTTLIESLEEVGGNPFLASLNIKTLEASQYEAVFNFLEKPDFENIIQKIDYYQRKPIIDRIFSLTSVGNKIGISFSITLVIIAILVTFNTIRLAIINSGEEIKIQRLVGASNWFIRGPFLIQGVISGIFAALISLIIFALVSWFLSPKLEFFLTGLNIFELFVKNIWNIVLIQFAAGILLAVFSSAIAIRKYLKV